jgi:hypothetical protein
MHVRDDYAARERRYAAECDEERRRSVTLARLRLATFVAAAGALTWWLGFDGRVPAAAVTMLLFLEFAVLVVVHARVESRAEWCEALRGVNARALARLDRRWDQLPDGSPPSGIDVENHPYAIDLDIFGRASVFQWIGPASTTFGQRTLASWLLSPASSGEIVARQQAVTELSALVDWRERLAAFGVLGGTTPQESIDTFMRWAASAEPPMRAFRVIRALVYVTLLAIWVPLLLHLSGVMPNGFWVLPLVFGIALSFFTAGSVSHVFDQAGASERTLRQYAEVLAHIDAQPFTAPRLAAIKDRLTVQAAGRSAPDAMKALNRILGFAELRTGAALLHFPIQALTLWDFHCAVRARGLASSVGARVRAWFDALADLDAADRPRRRALRPS